MNRLKDYRAILDNTYLSLWEMRQSYWKVSEQYRAVQVEAKKVINSANAARRKAENEVRTADKAVMQHINSNRWFNWANISGTV